jgi:hypothetical protein
MIPPPGEVPKLSVPVGGHAEVKFYFEEVTPTQSESGSTVNAARYQCPARASGAWGILRNKMVGEAVSMQPP